MNTPRPSPTRRSSTRPSPTRRNEAIVNGILIGTGLLVIVDNVVFHWILAFHRAVPGPNPLPAELALVTVSALLVAFGLWREKRARQ